MSDPRMRTSRNDLVADEMGPARDAPRRRAMVAESAPIAIRWRNFRSIHDLGWLNIRALTVVIGPNNSGKSSIVKPLLLLKQTLSTDDSDAALVTRGDLANVGSYSDAVWKHDVTLPLIFSLRFGPTFESGQDRPVGEAPPALVEIELRQSAGHGREIALSAFRIRDVFGRLMLSRLRQDDGTYSLRLYGGIGDEADGDSNGGGSDQTTQKIRRYVVEQGGPNKFLFEGSAALGGAFSGGAEPTSFDVPRQIVYYVAVVDFVRRQLTEFLRGVSYVGPLRDRLRRSYELAGDIPTHVGTGGARASEIIIARRDDPEFMDWLNKWMRAFGFRGGIHVVPGDAGTYQLTVQASRRAPMINIADCGFGLSQVLPFIVHGFHGRPHSLLIAEQPEIHLNPRLQIVLARLFVEMARNGKHVFVETHSEHFLTQLRLLVAGNRIKPDDVGLYYVEKRFVETQVRQINLSADGRLGAGEWPKGFFQETTSQAIELLKHRRGRRDGNATGD